MRNPYKGIYSYTAKDKDNFWGRDKEISDFTESILNSTSIVLAGYSGCGKTSLIKAGILPKLSEYDYHVITLTPRDVYDYDRRNRFALDFWERINIEIEKNWLDPTNNTSTIKLQITNKVNGQISKTPNTLWEKLYLCDFCDEGGFVHNFVIVLDQFEEIFQLDLNIKEVEKFFKIYEILCGAYNPNYAYIENKIFEIEEKKGDNYIKVNVKDEYHIFPDVNEYTKSNDNINSYNRFLISIRKDFLYDLQSYSKKYPILNKNTKYVEHLDDDQAKIVIDHGIPDGLKPTEGFNSTAITECIVQQSDFNNSDGETDYYVDTLTLSVVMYKLWEECDTNAGTKTFNYFKKNKIEPGTNRYDDQWDDYYIDFFKEEINRINSDGFEDKFKNILSDFYNDRINALKNESKVRKDEKMFIILEEICKKSNLSKIEENTFDEIFSEVEKISFEKETVYEEAIGSILDKKLKLQEYGTFEDNSDDNETVIKSVRQEIINILKKFSLSDIIKRCQNKIVKERLFRNLDQIIYDLQEKLLSDSGLYRQSLYLYEIGKIFDKYIYGDINFKKITDWVCCDKADNHYNVVINSKLHSILKELNIENAFTINEDFKQNLRLLFDKKKTNKDKDLAGKKCREEFNKLVYGSYKDKDKEDFKYIREEIIKVIKNCKLFVELNKGGKASMLEFRHDRLCEMAKEYMEIYKIRQNNIKKYTADVYFTPQGRLKADNCFVECFFGPWDTYSTIMRTIYFMEGDKNSIVDFDTDSINQFKKINFNNASSVIVSLALNKINEENDEKKEFYHNLPENFTHVRIKIEQGKIFNISFERREVGDNKDEVVRKVIIPTGYHKVRFYYDDYDRIVFKEFCVRDVTNTTDIRKTLPDGYNVIFYWYDDISSHFPTHTYFVNIVDDSIKLNDENDIYYYKKIKAIFDKDIASHSILDMNHFEQKYPIVLQHICDGNYGFKSQYDRYGREKSRCFIGSNMYQFDEIQIIYKSNENTNYSNLLQSVSFYKDSEPTTYPNSDVHLVKFVEYDDKNRIVETKYFGKDKKTECTLGINHIIGEKFKYLNNQVLSEYTIAESKQEIDGDVNGVKKVIIQKNNVSNCVENIEWFDSNSVTKEGRSIEALEYKGKYYNYVKAQFFIKEFIAEDHAFDYLEQNEMHRCSINYSKIRFEEKQGNSAVFLTGSTRILNKERCLENERLFDDVKPLMRDYPKYNVETINICDNISLDMIFVNGGSFLMGHEYEGDNENNNDDNTNNGVGDKYEYMEAKNVHHVEVRSFYIGQTTITQKQWNCVMVHKKRNFSKDTEDYPVVYVSWYDAQEFIEVLNKIVKDKNISFRLPTEEEWEFAAQGGVENAPFKYSGSDKIYDVAVFTKNNDGKRAAVKSKYPNGLGIYDMSGNVQEWCVNSFALYSKEDSKDDLKQEQGYLKILRGGGWRNTEQQCRVYHRYCAFPDMKNSNIGFRIVMEKKG